MMADTTPLTEVTDSMLDDADCGPLIFLPCRHTCFMAGMDGWMEMDSCYEVDDRVAPGSVKWLGLKHQHAVGPSCIGPCL